ncbi:hypothetical protein [Alteromonas gracilis]|uniref:hypothetical protein n=1 Tax=Alteromonas gracilis TaxID=1479524 RepID=UPI00373510D7
MKTAIKKPSIVTSVLLVISLTAFFLPLLVLTIIFPEAVENTISSPSTPLSGVLVGYLVMVFARCNLDVSRFGELVKPVDQRTKQNVEKKSWEAKVIFGISLIVFLMCLAMTGTSVASIIV